MSDLISLCARLTPPPKLRIVTHAALFFVQRFGGRVAHQSVAGLNDLV
jgi:hypothetical protein